jgi:DNA sulfur modification protein DndC
MADLLRRLERSSRMLVKAYEDNQTDFFFGYSGGKDSSAVLRVLFHALEQRCLPIRKTTIVYCDTGVEIPVLRDFAYHTLLGVHKEATNYGYNLGIKIAIPELKDRFFVKVIGRGYPSPTNKFRWCTDKLRIKPIQSALEECKESEENIVVLGIRYGESIERDKTINKHALSEEGFFLHSGSSKSRIFSPVYNYTTKEIWSLLGNYRLPHSIDYSRIFRIYKDADGECSIVRHRKAEPCASSRFGCWTCTVVREDKAMVSLIENGYGRLKPLLEFRNFLSVFRDDLNFREPCRRNGVAGPGPITLEGRKILLEKLFEAQEAYGHQLISKEELGEIQKLWKEDAEQNSRGNA